MKAENPDEKGRACNLCRLARLFHLNPASGNSPMPDILQNTSNLVVFGDSLSDNGNLFALTGQPPPPYWEGRFSNGPIYAEQLAALLDVPLQDLAVGGATASDTSPGAAPGINLPEQVAAYLAGLNGRPAPNGTTAVIYIGNNDYINFLESGQPKKKNPLTATDVEMNVVSNINNAVGALTAAGVDKIALFTLPDLAITPEFQALGPKAVASARALDMLNNTALAAIAAANPNVQLVDIFKLSDAVSADPLAFGLTDTTVPMIDLKAHKTTEFAPNEIGFFDGIHPTYAGQGIQAAFVDATLGSDHTQFLDGTQSVIQAEPGSNFIFATPLNSQILGLNDNYTIYGGSGSDLIFAGSGNVTVHGGSGTELIDAGSGNAKLYAGDGTDLLATNSLGTNLLVAGSGNDALIANRGGTNDIEGGAGSDLIVLKENASLVDPNGTFDFGTQTIAGGQGDDTLRFIINEQNPSAMDALVAEFQRVQTAFSQSIAQHHPGTFNVDGLNVTGIDSLQLQVDTVSTDPSTPYLITSSIIPSQDPSATISGSLDNLLTTASRWGLLTV
jgi:phospholipase/lecithinase/hemolysin